MTSVQTPWRLKVFICRLTAQKMSFLLRNCVKVPTTKSTVHHHIDIRMERAGNLCDALRRQKLARHSQHERHVSGKEDWRGGEHGGAKKRNLDTASLSSVGETTNWPATASATVCGRCLWPATAGHHISSVAALSLPVYQQPPIITTCARRDRCACFASRQRICSPNTSKRFRSLGWLVYSTASSPAVVLLW